MHLVGFIVRLYHEARSPERQTNKDLMCFSITFSSFFSLRNSLYVLRVYLKSVSATSSGILYFSLRNIAVMLFYIK